MKVLKKIIFLYRKYFFSEHKRATHMGVNIGNNCSLGNISWGSEPFLIKIGNHVQITDGVCFITHGAVWVLRDQDPTFDILGKIIIGNNVYIGNNALIMPGVTVGDNVIIGAGSIVTKSIPSGIIVGGESCKENRNY